MKMAEEMFNELGFELQFGGIYKHKETGKRICFDDYDGGYLDVMEIDLISLDLLKAINKQCEELGWLKDSDIKCID